jgi:hypothetical protein
MKSIFKYAILVAGALLLVATVAQASAQLAAISYGYPSIYQNAQTTAFSRDIQSAQDLESANVDFGAAATGLALGFPTISETSDQSYYAEHMDYSQTTSTAAFNYPYVSLGGDGGLSMLTALSGFGI